MGDASTRRKNRIIDSGTWESELREISEAIDSRSSQALLCIRITLGSCVYTLTPGLRAPHWKILTLKHLSTWAWASESLRSTQVMLIHSDV